MQKNTQISTLHIMTVMRSESCSEEQTLQIAAGIFHIMTRNSLPVFILLEGEMGSGKTAFCRGFAAEAGVSATVNSPTFSIMNEYSADRYRILHYDFYRIRSADEAEDLGFVSQWKQSIKEGLQEFHLIEWWQKAADRIPLHESVFLLKIEIPDYHADRRLITLSRYLDHRESIAGKKNTAD